MTDTWLPGCIRRPGPPSKRGYGGVVRRELAEIEGEVDHSTEGSLIAALGELDKLSRQASWHFTVDWDGTAYQHYALEDICWHCGLPGDRRFDTSLIGNMRLIGIEHVDRLPDGTMLATLTPAQLATSVRISQEIRDRCPRVAANPPALRLNMWEHNWLSATACPSGLIPWAAKFAAVQGQQEEDMALTAQQEADIAAAGEYGRWALANWAGPGGAKTVRDTILFSAQNLEATVRRIVAEELAKQPTGGSINQAVLVSAILTAMSERLKA